MLSREKHPVAWVMLLDQLADAREHLGALLVQMQTDGAIEEPDFAVQLGHVFAHLNRAWHGRDDATLDTVSEQEFAARSRYPLDLWPAG
jgi:hypothetical protein